MRAKRDGLTGYKPLVWPESSSLSAEEQECVELQRRDLWRHGIRKQPMLDKLAFEFGAVMCIMRTR
jgi:hypothetical protein